MRPQGLWLKTPILLISCLPGGFVIAFGVSLAFAEYLV